MPTTFEAIGAAFLAVLPGALFIWAFERVVGRWTFSLADRLLRFLGIAAAFHAVLAPLTYVLWRDNIKSGLFARGEVSIWLWPVVLGYLAAPFGLGWLLGWAQQAGKRWARPFQASAPAPTAWDAVFSGEPAGFVLIKLKSGRWIGGEFDQKTGSWVGGYPEPADIYLSVELEVDQETEDFVTDDDGNVRELGFGVLVRWEEVEYLELTPTTDEDTEEPEDEQTATQRSSEERVVTRPDPPTIRREDG